MIGGSLTPITITHRTGKPEAFGLRFGIQAEASACSGAGGKEPPKMTNYDFLSIEEIVALENRLVEKGTPLKKLMEHAGIALAELVEDKVFWGANVLIACGNGNNGGDGWACARRLAGVNYRVTLLSACAPEDIRNEPARTVACEVAEGCTRLTAEQALAAGIAPEVVEAGKALCGATSPDDIVAYAFGLPLTEGGAYDAVVDALLGTGFPGGQLKPEYKQVIQLMNGMKGFHAACDLPSGMNAATGAVDDICFQTTATATMLALKSGFATPGASELLGKLFVADLVD